MLSTRCKSGFKQLQIIKILNMSLLLLTVWIRIYWIWPTLSWYCSNCWWKLRRSIKLLLFRCYWDVEMMLLILRLLLLRLLLNMMILLSWQDGDDNCQIFCFLFFLEFFSLSHFWIVFPIFFLFSFFSFIFSKN